MPPPTPADSPSLLWTPGCLLSLPPRSSRPLSTEQPACPIAAAADVVLSQVRDQWELDWNGVPVCRRPVTPATAARAVSGLAVSALHEMQWSNSNPNSLPPSLSHSSFVQQHVAVAFWHCHLCHADPDAAVALRLTSFLCSVVLQSAAGGEHTHTKPLPRHAGKVSRREKVKEGRGAIAGGPMVRCSDGSHHQQAPAQQRPCLPRLNAKHQQTGRFHLKSRLRSTLGKAALHTTHTANQATYSRPPEDDTHCDAPPSLASHTVLQSTALLPCVLPPRPLWPPWPSIPSEHEGQRSNSNSLRCWIRTPPSHIIESLPCLSAHGTIQHSEAFLLSRRPRRKQAPNAARGLCTFSYIKTVVYRSQTLSEEGTKYPPDRYCAVPQPPLGASMSQARKNKGRMKIAAAQGRGCPEAATGMWTDRRARPNLIKTEYWDRAGGGGNISYDW